MTERNWAGNHEYRAAVVHRPTAMTDLQRVIAESDSLSVLGSRHSFTDIGDANALVSLDDMPRDSFVDHDGATVTVAGQMRYGDVVDVLRPAGLALHNLASLPHISVAGAIATATHGSGQLLGNLATAVAGVEIVTSTGDVAVLARGDADFAGAVVGLGALGAVTRVTLDVEPAFDVEQHVFCDMALDALVDSFDAIASAGYSVSAFTSFGTDAEQVWVKQRSDRSDGSVELGDEFQGARRARTELHPVPLMAAEACTAQLGVPGPWAERLPHFRLDHAPSAGDEIQSECFVDRADAAAAIGALRNLAHDMGPAWADVLMVGEIRTIAADQLWMSPQYGRDCVAFHFTWRRDSAAAARVVGRIEQALAPFASRPHWGKIFGFEAFDPAGTYPRCGDFLDLVERYDGRRVFRNEWFARVFG